VAGAAAAVTTNSEHGRAGRRGQLELAFATDSVVLECRRQQRPVGNGVGHGDASGDAAVAAPLRNILPVRLAEVVAEVVLATESGGLAMAVGTVVLLILGGAGGDTDTAMGARRRGGSIVVGAG